MVDTAAIGGADACPVERPAALMTIGKTLASPAPRQANPPMATSGWAISKDEPSPAAASAPPKRVSLTGPQAGAQSITE